MRGSVPSRLLVLAAFFGWSLVSSFREWLRIGVATTPPVHGTCATLTAAPTHGADDPRINMRVPPAARALVN